MKKNTTQKPEIVESTNRKNIIYPKQMRTNSI